MTAWALDTLVATTALMLFVLAVREPVRRQFGAAAAYALWLIPAARMAMPPISQTVERIVPATTNAGGPIAQVAIAPPVPSAAISLIEQFGGWPTLLFTLWTTGALLILALGIVRYRRQRRLVLNGSTQLVRLGSIRLVRSHAVRGPIAFGIFDRVIAVPHDFEQRFDAAQRRLALDHELSHHRSGDLIVNHVAFVLLGLLWFNPVAWLAHAAFRFDQEAACDARILDHAGPDDRAAYGHAIAKAASGRTLLFASALDHHHNLHRRLNSMLYHQTPKRRLAGKLIIIGALAMAVPLTATRAIDFVDIAAPIPPPPPAPTSPDNARIELAAAAFDQAPTRADMETAKGDLKVLRRDQETARRDSETARRDSETALRDAETALRDSATARRDREAALRDRETALRDNGRSRRDFEAARGAPY